MKILEFAFIAYPSTDAARSRAFYEGVLGLPCTLEHNENGQFWMEFSVGPHTVGVGNEPFLKAHRDGPQVVLEVEDLDAAMAHLRAHDVPVLMEPFAGPACRAAMVSDPDGNSIGLHQRARR